jgi:Carbohydrate esterase, sialic acid-specific acetylesterase
VFQRDPATDLGTIAIDGFYDAALAGTAPSAIEARWGAAPWQVVDSHPRDGRFGGELPGASVSLGRQPFQARFANAPGIQITVADVGVGDVFVVAGQSNAELWLTTRTASALGASAYRLGTDPHDPERVIWADDPLTQCSFFRPGSVYPALMDRMTAANDVPVMFIAGARPDTRIADFQPGTVGWTPLVQNIADGTASRMNPRFVLWLQGESDVGRLTTAQFRALSLSFFDALQAELAQPIPILVGVIGNIEDGIPVAAGGRGTFAEAEAIRAAQRALPSQRPGELLAGADTTGLPFGPDGVHFDDAAAPGLLDRWCEAIDGADFGVACPN